MARAPEERPWSLLVRFISAYAPFKTPQEYFEPYDPSEVPPPVQFDPHERPDNPPIVHLHQIVPHGADLPLERVQALRAANYATATYLDALVGRVLAVLQASGRADETLVVYTSDHGFSLADHYIFGLFHMFEESLKVPLILRGSSVSAGGQCGAPVSHADHFPTLTEATGSGAGTSPLGTSLWPLLSGAAADRGPVLTESHGTAMRSGGYVLRDGPYKLIHFIDMPPQPYDHEADPAETLNLADDPAQTGTLDRLMPLLEAMVDPIEVDAEAGATQAARIEAHGGKAAVLRKMAGFSYSPPPSVHWQDMDRNRT